MSINRILFTFILIMIMIQKVYSINHGGQPHWDHNKSTLIIQAARLDTFCVENDTLIQQMIIKKLSKWKIKFSLTVRDKIRNVSCSNSGIATNPYADYDPNVGEDDNGEYYECQNYYLDGKKGSVMTIAICTYTKIKVKVISYGFYDPTGDGFGKTLCTLNSIGDLKRKSKK